VIGDVSGKGIPAALFMAVTRTQVKTTAQRGMPPAECFHEVNRVLVQEQVSAMFATCFYGLLNLKSGEFHYCSAGHNPPYVLRAGGGAAEPITEVGGIPLGLFDGMGYTGSTVHRGGRFTFPLHRWSTRGPECGRTRFDRCSADGNTGRRQHSQLPGPDPLCNPRGIRVHPGRASVGRHHDALHPSSPANGVGGAGAG
jgi:hypothetical protein